MRLLRSIAFCAVALMASAFAIMPASAAIPISPGIHADVDHAKQSYPASQATVTDSAALACIVPVAGIPVSTGRSIDAARSYHLASISVDRMPTVEFRRRC